MKKRLFGLFLALTLAFTCFAVAACGKKEEKPIGDPVTVELAYAEDTGMLSWSAVEGATKYTIRLNNVNDSAKSEVTTNCIFAEDLRAFRLSPRTNRAESAATDLKPSPWSPTSARPRR